MELSKEYNDLLQLVANGNAEAYNYLVIMSSVIRIWDDLWDKDKDVEKEDADAILASLAFDLSRNGFYQANRQALEAFSFVAWNAWKDANEWKGSKDKMEGVCAWFIRDFCNEIDTLVAWLVGGISHARKVSLICRKFYLKQLSSRGLDGFI